MKYVRTKDEIREYNELVSTIRYWYTNVVDSDDIEKSVEEDIKNLNIVAQADTIEELCDEFYIDYGKKRFPFSTYRQHERYAGWGDLIRYLKTIHFTGYDGVYGYIWFGNELKLVAKMNDKGELELL